MDINIQIVLGVLLTSTLSGLMGMGGGIILMALYLSILPLQLAMILHGFTQLASNGFRTYLHRSEIKKGIVAPYLIGGVIAFIVLKLFQFNPKKEVVLIMLGLFPFISLLPIISKHTDITKKWRPLLSGLSVTAAQVMAGASGAILDIFFINSPLNRHQIIATKSITQTIGHTIKMGYYLMLLESFENLLEIKVFTYLAVIMATFIGNYCGKLLLNMMNEAQFKTASKALILLIGAGLLFKGASLSWAYHSPN